MDQQYIMYGDNNVPVRLLLLYGNSSKTIINYEFYMYLKLTNQS